MSSNVTLDEKENIVVSNVFNPAVEGNNEIVPLTTNALQYYDDIKKEAVLRLSQDIDVTKLDNVMSYGQIPLLRAFEESGKVLKDEQGSAADQEVIRQVIEISKEANQSYEDFNIVLKEPNFIQRLLLKISSSARHKRDEELKVRAVTNYKLLEKLRDSCDEWLKMLQNGYGQITLASSQDRLNCDELEQYIVAGHIAKERIQKELELAKSNWEKSGLQEDEDRYNTLKEGLDTFEVVLLNLEKSRSAFKISIGQLMLQERANKNIQISIRTQKTSSMALASIQLRNAILDAKNKEALEGQKSINKLNDELIKKVSENVVLTAEESEEVLLNGVYSVESGLEAAKTVITGCQNIMKAREQRADKIGQEMTKLKELINELEPYISKVKSTSTTAFIDKSSNPSNVSSKGGLTF